MASNMMLGFSIGASLSSSFSAAFAGATNTISKLDTQTSQLTAKQKRLGGILSSSTNRPHANLSKLTAQYDKIGKAINRNVLAQEKLNASIAKSSNLKTERAGLRSDAMETVGTGVAFATPFIASAKSAIEFESAMAEVNKTVNFSNEDGLPKLGENLKQLSLEIPMTAKELAGITAAGGQLGIAEKDLLGYTETVAKMSVAFDMSADDAGDSMAKLANIYKLPIESIEATGDAINALSNSSPSKAREIVNTLGRVGGLAQQFGLTVNETTALSGAFIALGKPPEVAATAINGMMTTLSTLDPKNKKQAGVFQQMGLDMGKFSQLVKTDGQQAIMTLLSSIEKIPKADRIGALTGLFGREYADDVAALSGGIDTYTDQLKTLQAVDSSGKSQYIGSMGTEFDKMKGTTGNQIKLLKNNFNVLAITIGDALLPAINDSIVMIKPLVKSFAGWAKENPELITQMAMLVAGLFAGKIAFIGLGYGFNLVRSGLNSVLLPMRFVTSKWSILRGAMALGVKKPKGLARFAKGLKGAGNLLGKFSLKLGSGTVRGSLLFASTMKKLGFYSLAASKILAGKGLAGIVKLGGGLMKIARIVRVVGMAMMANPIVLAAVAIAAAAYLIYRNWGTIKPFFINLWNTIKAKATAGINRIKSAISRFKPLTYFRRAMQPIMPYSHQVWGRLKAFANSGVGNILKTIARFSPIGLFIRAWSAVFGYFSGLSSKFRSYGASIIQGLIGGVTAKLGVLKAKISGVASMMAGVFSGKLEINSPSKLFTRIAHSIPEGIGLGVDDKSSVAMDAVNRMSSKIGGHKLDMPQIGQLGNLSNLGKGDGAMGMGGLTLPQSQTKRPLIPASNDADVRFANAKEQSMQKRVEQTNQSNKVLANNSVNNQQSQSYVIHFNPTINMNNATATGGDENTAQGMAKMTVQELERMMERIEGSRQRRAFA